MQNNKEKKQQLKDLIDLAEKIKVERKIRNIKCSRIWKSNSNIETKQIECKR